MLQATQSGLEDAFRFKLKASLTVEYIPLRSLVDRSEKAAFFLTTLVASMANAAGGIIFVGVQAKRKIPQTVTPIEDSEFAAWMQHVCASDISPAIPGLIIHSIPVSDSGASVIGIQIPESSAAPHMSSDYRYYRRVANKVTLMEEYEIRDLYIKGSRPDIDIYTVTNTEGIPLMSGGKIQKLNFYPRFLVKNIGSCVEQYYKVELSIPSAINNASFNTIQDYFSRFEDGCTVYAVTGKTPLFQNEIATVIEPNLVVDASNFQQFSQGEITLKFYFSTGVRTKIFHAVELLLYRKKQLKIEDFAQETQTLFTDTIK